MTDKRIEAAAIIAEIQRAGGWSAYSKMRVVDLLRELEQPGWVRVDVNDPQLRDKIAHVIMEWETDKSGDEQHFSRYATEFYSAADAVLAALGGPPND